MVLNLDHDVLKVERGDETTAGGILRLEGLGRVFLVEVVQELAELGIVDGALLLLAKVALHKVTVQAQRKLAEQIGLLDHRHEVVCGGGGNAGKRSVGHSMYVRAKFNGTGSVRRVAITKPPGTRTVRDRSVALRVEQLERGLVERVGRAQETLERLELGEGDETVLARVHDPGEQLHRLLERKN